MDIMHRIEPEVPEKLLTQAEISANRFSMKALWVLAFLAALSGVLNLLGIFNADRHIMLPSMAAAVILFLLPTAVQRGTKGDMVPDPRFTHLIITCVHLGIMLLCVALASHGVILMAIPPLIAAQYRMDRKLLIRTLILCVILVPVGVYGGFFFGTPDRNLLKIMTDGSAVDLARRLELATPKRMWELFTHYTLPRLFGMVAIVLLIYGIAVRHNRLLVRQAQLSRQVQEEMERLNSMQSKVIDSLATLIENRDEDTGEHVIRTKLYVRMIAEELRKEGKYKDLLTAEAVDRFQSAAPLHDVGKVAVSDSILLKPGKLTPEEFEQMKTHTTKGSAMVEKILSGMNEDGLLEAAKDIALYHHERWDGRGYPQGLRGEDIPLSARIMAAADVYDALVSPRVYKAPVTPEKALEMMAEESGTHFDPEIMHTVLNMRDLLITAAKTPIQN